MEKFIFLFGLLSCTSFKISAMDSQSPLPLIHKIHLLNTMAASEHWSIHEIKKTEKSTSYFMPSEHRPTNQELKEIGEGLAFFARKAEEHSPQTSIAPKSAITETLKDLKNEFSPQECCTILSYYNLSLFSNERTSLELKQMARRANKQTTLNGVERYFAYLSKKLSPSQYSYVVDHYQFRMPHYRATIFDLQSIAKNLVQGVRGVKSHGAIQEELNIYVDLIGNMLKQKFSDSEARYIGRVFDHILCADRKAQPYCKQ